MIAVVAGLAMVCAASIIWVMQGWGERAWQRYRSVYTHEATVRLSEVFLFVDARQLWGLNLLMLVFTAAVIWLVSGNVLAAAVAAAIAMHTPQRALAWLRRRRLASFDQQLPDAVLALAGGLRAGASVSGAMKHIVAHSAPPLAQELGLLLREQRLGIPFDTALLNLRGRMPSEATELIVACLRLAAQTGGNLSDSLERIAETLRARLQLEAKVRALTAQGRMQAWIVGALPVALILVLYQLDPRTMAALWETPTGLAVLSGVALLEFVGVMLIRKIVTIEI